MNRYSNRNLPLYRLPFALGLFFVVTACVRESERGIDESIQQSDGVERSTERLEALSKPPAQIDVELPEVNPRRGRILFITKGCVICHQINDVGGTAAPQLDRPANQSSVNPIEFSARMWRGAGAMISLQSVELGYVIELDGQDIADLAAFAASNEERLFLTLESIPVSMQEWFLNTPYWRSDDWSEYKERGDRIPLEETPE
ncbi:c-type cytochrome [Hyphococcus sp. DH-69]|uniref:c-type cytochrome n=1 Tax=Hyphococcus formosus TaxID=3143534 RepID=UPI00398AD840